MFNFTNPNACTNIIVNFENKALLSHLQLNINEEARICCHKTSVISNQAWFHIFLIDNISINCRGESRISNMGFPVVAGTPRCARL